MHTLEFLERIFLSRSEGTTAPSGRHLGTLPDLEWFIIVFVARVLVGLLGTEGREVEVVEVRAQSDGCGVRNET